MPTRIEGVIRKDFDLGSTTALGWLLSGFGVLEIGVTIETAGNRGARSRHTDTTAKSILLIGRHRGYKASNPFTNARHLFGT